VAVCNGHDKEISYSVTEEKYIDKLSAYETDGIPWS
jgi:hypothetical protein